MQLITRTTTDGYEDWRSDFDDGAERRGRAGLSVLQIWRDLDAPDTVMLLFEATDRGRAEAYLKEREQMGHGLGTATFLATA